MKKFLKIFIFIIIMFCLLDNVSAKVCEGISNSGVKSTSVSSPFIFNSSYSININYICGPYFSYDDSNTDVLFVDLKAGDVHKLDIKDRSKDPDTGILPIVGKFNGSICPNYLYVNGNNFKDTAENGYEKNYFYVQQPTICSYDINNSGFKANFSLIYYTSDNYNRLYINYRSNAKNQPYDKIRVRNYSGFNYWFGDISGISNVEYSDNVINSLKNFELNGCPNLYLYEISLSDTRNGIVYILVPTKEMLDFLVDHEYKISGLKPNTYEATGTLITDDYYLSDSVKAIYDFNKDDLIDELKKCNNDSSCLLSMSTKIDNSARDISDFCNEIFANCDYNDDLMLECLKIDKDITEIKKQFNLSGGDCGVSSRIIKFIANIFKWVKYIAPVLAIILGILDFIKAISSQSDDEMKKAQGKFVKRLIAAALLFIVPFGIEFILDKFNVAGDNPFCNLI